MNLDDILEQSGYQKCSNTSCILEHWIP